MSDGSTIRTTKGTAYEAPRVIEESLDRGGNYVGPSWPDQKMTDTVTTFSTGGMGTLLNSDDLNG